MIGLELPLCQMRYGGCGQICSIVGIAVWVVRKSLVLGQRRSPVCISAESRGCVWRLAVWLVLGVRVYGLGLVGIVLYHLLIVRLCCVMWCCALVVGGALVALGMIVGVVVSCLPGVWWGFLVVCWVGLIAVDAFALVR